MRIINKMAIQPNTPNDNRVLWLNGSNASYYNNGTWVTIGKSSEDGKELEEKVDSLDKGVDQVNKDLKRLDNRSSQMEESIKNISVTGGASVAEAVTYDNTTSGLESVNVKGAVDELQGSKIDKTSIVHETGESEDLVMSQKSVSNKLSDLNELVTKNQEDVNSTLDKPDFKIIERGWLDKNNRFYKDTNSYFTDTYIKTKKGMVFYVTAKTQFGQPCIYLMFDANKKVISYLDTDGTDYTNERIEITDPNVRFIRFSSYGKELKVTMTDNFSRIAENEKNIAKNQEAITALSAIRTVVNVLFGKKYAFCGDSYTEANFSTLTDENGLIGKESPEFWDSINNVWKSYAWHICNRNNMKMYADGRSGTRMTIVYNEDGSIKTEDSFSNTRYLNIPSDTDYCTLMFGLNEIDVEVGTKDSTDKSTLWGAWNVVLKHLIEHHPFMKIGIIIPDSWEPKAQSDELKKIATWWGIPYLDLKGENVPLGIGGRFESLNPEVRKLRDKAFQISDKNAHPNSKAHLYRSTIIENFLRSL